MGYVKLPHDPSTTGKGIAIAAVGLVALATRLILFVRFIRNNPEEHDLYEGIHNA